MTRWLAAARMAKSARTQPTKPTKPQAGEVSSVLSVLSEGKDPATLPQEAPQNTEAIDPPSL